MLLLVFEITWLKQLTLGSLLIPYWGNNMGTLMVIFEPMLEADFLEAFGAVK